MTCHARPWLTSISTTCPAWDGVTWPLSTTDRPTAVERADEASATTAWTCWEIVTLWAPPEVTYHCWSVITVPRARVNVYLPELSALVVVTCWKLDWPGSLLHNATAAPEAALPEITTFWPALDGSGDAVIVGVAGTQVPGAQQVDPAGQHVVPGQHAV
jgi:hypothetical protein